MRGEFWETIATIAVAITGVALVAVIVSRNSQTPAVIQAGGSAFANGLDVAVSPVTGKATAPNLSYPSSSGFGFEIPSLTAPVY